MATNGDRNLAIDTVVWIRQRRFVRGVNKPCECPDCHRPDISLAWG